MLRRYFFALLSLLLLLPAIASAEITYRFLAPLPGFGNSVSDIDGLLATLITYINIFIGVAGVLGVGRLVVCGFELLTAPGESQRSHAKECVLTVIIGLLLAISGFVLLQSINPALNEPSLDLPAIEGTGMEVPGGRNRPTAPGWYYAYRAARTGNEVYSTAATNQAQCRANEEARQGQGVEITQQCFEVRPPAGGACTTCVSLAPVPIRPTGQVCSGAAPCQADPALRDRLINLQSRVGGWAVTEAYPPTRQHQNPCHALGTCVDADYLDNRSGAADVLNFITAAEAAGLRAVYEVTTTAEYTQLRQAGVPAANLYNGSGWINGNHFSVYMN